MTTLPKPYNPRELLARLHAIMRRREPVEAPGSPSKGDEVVQFGDFTLDLGTRKLKKGEEEIPLTTGEFCRVEDICTPSESSAFQR